MKAVNLLPSEYRRRAGSGRPRSSYALVGALAVLLLLVAVYVLSANQVTSRQTQATKAGSQADVLERRVQALGPFGQFTQIKQTRVASVRELAGGRFDWERLMRELSLVLPRGSWLQTADASLTGAISGAGTTTPDPANAGKPALNLTGCTRRQFEVATIMRRLGELYRVSGVELNESKEDPKAETAGLQSCGRYVAFNVTVLFDPEPPKDEVPPGTRRVPTTLGGGS